jgi:hypothetical protein
MVPVVVVAASIEPSDVARDQCRRTCGSLPTGTVLTEHLGATGGLARTLLPA